MAEDTNVGFYTVLKGDTLGKIAKKLGKSLGVLKALNPDLDEKRMKIGSKINLPVPKDSIPVKPMPQSGIPQREPFSWGGGGFGTMSGEPPPPQPAPTMPASAPSVPMSGMTPEEVAASDAAKASMPSGGGGFEGWVDRNLGQTGKQGIREALALVNSLGPLGAPGMTMTRGALSGVGKLGETAGNAFSVPQYAAIARNEGMQGLKTGAGTFRNVADDAVPNASPVAESMPYTPPGLTEQLQNIHKYAPKVKPAPRRTGPELLTGEALAARRAKYSKPRQAEINNPVQVDATTLKKVDDFRKALTANKGTVILENAESLGFSSPRVVIHGSTATGKFSPEHALDAVGTPYLSKSQFLQAIKAAGLR